MDPQLEAYMKVKLGDIVVPIKDACGMDTNLGESYPTGYETLDAMMKYRDDPKMRGGIRGGELIIITGLSGSGKTSFSQALTLNLDKEAIPIVWFSYEVAVASLYNKFKLMGISDEALVYTTKRNISGNLSWIKAKILEAQEKYDSKVVFIDDLTFLSPTNSKNTDQFRMVLQNIVVELKSLAVELNIIIFLMAHVRKIQAGKEIEMQDLAESASIYQKCDYLLAVQRGYTIVKVQDRDCLIGDDTGFVKVLKNRPFGNLGIMEFKYINNMMLEEPRDPSQEAEDVKLQIQKKIADKVWLDKYDNWRKKVEKDKIEKRILIFKKEQFMADQKNKQQ